MALVHGQGLVLRDLDPNNVMVTPDGELRLIDLELLARPGELVAAAYTPGYLAPELAGLPAIGPAPEPAADLFGLGATLFYLVTGTDPLLPPDEPHPRPHRERMASWLHQVAGGNEAARRLAPIIAALLHEDPARRPGLEAVRAGLADRSAPAPTRSPGGSTTPISGGWSTTRWGTSSPRWILTTPRACGRRLPSAPRPTR